MASWLLPLSWKKTGKHLVALRKNLNLYFTQWENYIVLNSNVEAENKEMVNLTKSFNLRSFIRIPKCFKNPENVSYCSY